MRWKTTSPLVTEGLARPRAFDDLATRHDLPLQELWFDSGSTRGPTTTITNIVLVAVGEINSPRGMGTM